MCTHDEVKELIFFFKCVVCPGVFLHKGFIAKNMYQLAKGKSSFQMNNKWYGSINTLDYEHCEISFFNV